MKFMYSGSTSSQNILRAEFDRLVRAHYVERCPRPEPFISPPEEDKLTSTKRRGSKLSLLLRDFSLFASSFCDKDLLKILTGLVNSISLLRLQISI